MKSTILSLLALPFTIAAPLPISNRDATADSTTTASINKLIQPLGKIYFGVATDQNRISTGQNAQIIKSDFGQVTPENSMKWRNIEPQDNQFNFTDSDYLVDWATKNGKVIRGHTLIWHQGLPAWVTQITDKTILENVLKRHITTVMTRYKGKIRAWDVCNEVFQSDGTMRPSVWYNVLGEDFISIAYHAARAADPDAKLYLNDFAMDDPYNPKINDGMIAHINKWISAGVPIDGIGSQTHLTSPNSTGSVFLALSALSIQTPIKEIAITELDITDAGTEDYTAVVSACLAVSNCVGITTWGLSDADSYRSADSPLLFDAGFQPKAAYTGIAKMLSDTPPRRV